MLEDHNTIKTYPKHDLKCVLLTMACYMIYVIHFHGNKKST